MNKRQSKKKYSSMYGVPCRLEDLPKSCNNSMCKHFTGHIQTVKEIERLYEEASKQQDRFAEYSKEWKEFERYTDALPQEAWIQ